MSDLNKMWAALEAYQPIADQNGHGESWRKMTQERTAKAALDAALDRGGTTAWNAARHAAWAARAMRDANLAIEYINKATKEVKS